MADGALQDTCKTLIVEVRFAAREGRVLDAFTAVPWKRRRHAGGVFHRRAGASLGQRAVH